MTYDEAPISMNPAVAVRDYAQSKSELEHAHSMRIPCTRSRNADAISVRGCSDSTAASVPRAHVPRPRGLSDLHVAAVAVERAKQQVTPPSASVPRAHVAGPRPRDLNVFAVVVQEPRPVLGGVHLSKNAIYNDE